ncbi:conserved hypothetical protein [Ricinus communis]|uniref:Uncharacterized protein n=1 Tax=Ricinus communis TaxID=3988 RepID=B9RJG1_RICCO|nr:conserved hypothetical protein [Ricinus communis]
MECIGCRFSPIYPLPTEIYSPISLKDDSYIYNCAGILLQFTARFPRVGPIDEHNSE